MRRFTVLMATIMLMISAVEAFAQSAVPASDGGLRSVADLVLHPWVTFILVSLGMALVIAELVSIGSWGVTGSAGVLCLGCVVGSSVLAGVVAWTGVALLLAGTALLLVESRILPGKGISVAAGLICLFLGMFWTLGGAMYSALISAEFALMAAIAFLVHLPTNSAWQVAGRRIEVTGSCEGGTTAGHAEIKCLDETSPEPEISENKIPGHDADLGSRHSDDDDDQQIIRGRNG